MEVLFYEKIVILTYNTISPPTYLHLNVWNVYLTEMRLVKDYTRRFPLKREE